MKTNTSSAGPGATGAGARLAAMALAAVGAMALAGCENPQPTAAPEQATAAPPPGDTALMGAPSTRTPQYVGPSGPPYPAPPPPPGYGPGYPPPPPPAAPYPPTAYPPGYGHQTGPGAPGEIVAMAPIPNPPETGWYYGRHYGGEPGVPHHRHHVWMYGGGAAYAGAPWRPHHHHHQRSYAPVAPPARPAPAAPAHPAPVHPHPAAPAAHHPAAAAAGAAATAAAGAQLLKPHAPNGRHHHRVDEATSAAAAGGPTNTAANATGAATGNVTGTEADRYKALESLLHESFEHAAVLTVPANMTPGQPATVTLTLPADFVATVQRDAGEQDLSDAAAGMNLLATLSGDGYTIVPTEAQTVALASGQASSFQWQVTPGTGVKGPLKANVRAQVVSAGQFLNLGDKVQGDNLLAGKVIGIGLLVLIAALILGWAVRRKPSRPQGVVRRPAYDQYPTTPPGK